MKIDWDKVAKAQGWAVLLTLLALALALVIVTLTADRAGAVTYVTSSDYGRLSNGVVSKNPVGLRVKSVRPDDGLGVTSPRTLQVWRSSSLFGWNNNPATYDCRLYKSGTFGVRTLVARRTGVLPAAKDGSAYRSLPTSWLRRVPGYPLVTCFIKVPRTLTDATARLAVRL